MSPTFHVAPAVGRSMVGTGGEPFALITTDAVSEAPWLSDTRTVTVYVPAAYVREGFTTVESPYVPSPSRFHE